MMHREQIISVIVFMLLLTITCCIEPAYIQQTDTPPNLEGFLGFRWDTPMSILDDHLMQTLDVVPCEHYYDYYSLAYENFYFMDKKAFQCQCIFNGGGFSEARLIFLTEQQYAFSDLDYLLERIEEVYGRPAQMAASAADPEFTGYIEGYYWFGGSLVVALMPDEEIIVHAYGYPKEPPDLHHFYITRTRVENGPVNWEH